MGEAEIISELVTRINKTLEFLDKLKLSGSKKKEKDAISNDLRDSVKKCASTFAVDGDVYDDVGGIQPSGEIYDDTGESTTYDDTQTYDDTSAAAPPLPPPLPTQQEIPPTECESLTNFTRAEGVEMKQSRRLTLLTGSWQKRWCVLQGGIFYIYETSKDKKQKEAFNIRTMTFDLRDDITKESKRKDRCFELKSEDGSKSFEFCAADRAAALTWQNLMGLPSSGNRRSESTASLTNSAGDNYDDVQQAPIEREKTKKGFSLNLFNKPKTPKHSAADSQDNYDDTGTNYDDTGVTNGGAAPPGFDDQDTYEDYEEDQTALKSPTSRNLPLPPPPGESKSPSRTASQRSNGSAPARDTNERPPMPIPQEAPMLHSSIPLPPEPARKLPSVPKEDSLPPPPVGSEINKEEDYDNLFQGMWDCSTDDTSELPFKRGEILYILSREFDEYGWWIAELGEKIGLVPKDFLMEAYEM